MSRTGSIAGLLLFLSSCAGSGTMEAVTPGAVLRNIEERLHQARTVRVKAKHRVSMRAMIEGVEQTMAYESRAILFLQRGNKASWTYGMEEGESVLISDGVDISWLMGVDLFRELKTPGSLNDNLSTLLVYFGTYWGTYALTMMTVASDVVRTPERKNSFPHADVKRQFRVTCVRHGPEKGDSRSVTFKIDSKFRMDSDRREAFEVTLWYDPRTYRLLGGTWTGGILPNEDEMPVSVSVTETFEESAVDADVPEGVFKLPRE